MGLEQGVMAGVEALGGAVTWGEVGAILAAVGALGTALFGIANTKYRTEDNSKQIEALMSQVQAIRDQKPDRAELKDAIVDIKNIVREQRQEFRDLVTGVSNQISSQISNLSTRVDSAMRGSRAHSGG